MHNTIATMALLVVGACTQAPVEWTTIYSLYIPYYNTTTSSVQAFAEPFGGAPVGEIAPREGGFIKTCNRNGAWCLISFGGRGQSGWVEMINFGGDAR